ncbi:HDOD domain-containing protein [Rhodoferax ferrireducens]|uniref:HDOD domain-containing protein n=1 Tax=Rhodoferax ferrireducens TaxID=192843 RepID=UPI000E0CFA3F|nr:HDOD domain-containing protein [Rhodoferax ferrireducens]
MNTVEPEDILRKIHNLPSLPTVVIELLASMDEDDVNIDALSKKIAQDQALTAKTLRLANSSFYGMANQVTSIHEAIAILGFRTVRSVATTAALIGAFAGHGSVNANPFWRHAMAAAICARELAPHLNLNPEHAYTAGLLHDIGRLVLVTQFQPHYEATMLYRAQHDCHLLEAERAVMGVDHTVAGHVLTRHWKFPESVQQAVACHHAPLVQGLQTLSLSILAANTIAHALDMSQDRDDLVPPVPAGLWKQLGLDEKALHKVFKNAEKQFEGANLLLNN